MMLFAIADEMKIYGLPWASRVEFFATFDWLGDNARATEYVQRTFARASPNIPDPLIFPSRVLASIALRPGHRVQAAEWLAPLSTDSNLPDVRRVMAE